MEFEKLKEIIAGGIEALMRMRLQMRFYICRMILEQIPWMYFQIIMAIEEEFDIEIRR